jgi:ribosomal-protein-alanine N-acetyltransferase
MQMGVDLSKLPSKNKLTEMVIQQIYHTITDKKSYALIWELNKMQIGHSNVTRIEYSEETTMHLHLWKSTHRNQGIGTELVKRSLPFYFNKLKIKKLICEPYALNP